MRLEDFRNFQSWVIFLGLCALAWASVGYFWNGAESIDSGIFSSMGYHLLHGKVLYRDIWDSKPPLVFFLNAAALWLLGLKVTAIRVFERFFAFGALSALYLVLARLIRIRWVAFVSVLLFYGLFYGQDLFDGGNFTEEYGACFELMALCCLALSLESGASRRLWALEAGFGALVSLSILTKEVFVLPCGVLVLYWLFLGLRQRETFKRGLWVAAGGLAPLLFFAIYFVATHSLVYWLDEVSYNFAYSAAGGSRGLHSFVENWDMVARLFFSKSWVFDALCLLGVSSALVGAFSRERRHFPRMVVCLALADFLGTMVSQRRFQHYYLQLAPSIVLLAGCGLAFLTELAAKFSWPDGWVLATVLGALLTLDPVWIGSCVVRPAAASNAPSLAWADYIRSHTRSDQTIWIADGSFAQLYFLADRRSATKYHFVFDHVFLNSKLDSAAAKVETLLGQLKSACPEMIIETESLRDKMTTMSSVFKWIDRNYLVLTPGAPIPSITLGNPSDAGRVYVPVLKTLRTQKCS